MIATPTKKPRKHFRPHGALVQRRDLLLEGGTWPSVPCNSILARLPPKRPSTKWLLNFTLHLRLMMRLRPSASALRTQAFRTVTKKTGEKLTIKQVDKRLRCLKKTAQPGLARARNTHFSLLKVLCGKQAV